MITLSPQTITAYARRMERAGVPPTERPAYQKWIRYYLDFCQKHAHPARSGSSVPLFLEKLLAKGQSEPRRCQAERAVNLLIRAGGRASPCAPGHPLEGTPPPGTPEKTPRAAAPEERTRAGGFPEYGSLEMSAWSGAPRIGEPGPDAPSGPGETALASTGEEPSGRGASWEREYQDLQGAIRLRNHSPRTHEAYRHWVAQFQAFVKSRPCNGLTPADVKAFLTDLAVRKNVAASSQNQAFNALLFFFRHVLGQEFGKLDGVVRAKRRPYVPVTLSKGEVDALLATIEPPYRLVAALLYGCGLRLTECLELRVQCINLDARLLTVHDGKGKKDRSVPLPVVLLPAIRDQLEAVRRLHQADLAAGYAGVFLPGQLEKKYRNAAREFVWQWYFPAVRLTEDTSSGGRKRYHLHQSHVQAAVKRAAEAAGIPKRVTPHGLRHTYASHLLMANYDLQTIQKLLGHGDVKTTMIYLQTVPGVTLKEARSPMDLR